MPGHPRVPTHDPPRVESPSPPTPAHPIVANPPWSPPPSPAGSTFLSPTPVQAPFQATPRRLDFASTPSPRVGSSPQMPSPSPPLNLPAREPVAHRTRSRAPAPAPLALFTAGRPLHECVTYQMPTAKPLGPLRSHSALQASAGPCQPQRFRDLPASATHYPY
jgi:hypothetical protein